MSEHIPGRRTSTGAAKLVRFAGAGGLLEIGPRTVEKGNAKRVLMRKNH